MHSQRLAVAEFERAALRLRLALAALATTLVLLAGSAPAVLAVSLAAYVALAVIARSLAPRLRLAAIPILALALDLAVITMAVAALPLGLPAWILFLFPIGIAALRYGQLGAAAAAAIAIVLVDVVVALRLPEADAVQLWPVQFLVAAALVTVELVRARERDSAEREDLRRRSAALADLSGALTTTQVLRAATDHASRVPGIAGAWAWTERDGAFLVEHERGDVAAPVRSSRPKLADLPPRGNATHLARVVAEADGKILGIHDAPRIALGVRFVDDGAAADRRDAMLLDLADAAGRALAATVERERAERAVGELRIQLEQVRGLLRQKEEAVATAVHELRNPLTSVGGYAQIMARNLDTIQRQVAQLARLITDLQPMATPANDLTVVPTDLRELVRGAVARARVLADADVKLEEPVSPLIVNVDAPRIGQVVDNLVGNAVKYSTPPARVEVSLRDEEEGVVIRVSDRGRGISPEDLPRLFDRGYRARGAGDVRGEGIGLALVREIVEGHGGRVGASSPGQGKGATFWVVLPRDGIPLKQKGQEGVPTHGSDPVGSASVPDGTG